MTYTAPLADMRFALREVAGLRQVAALPGYEHATDDTVDAVLEEAAKLAGNGLAPLNRDGDKVGAKLENGVVRTAPGFAGIYKEFVAGGWNSLPFDPGVRRPGHAVAARGHRAGDVAGGQHGLRPVPLLTQGAIDAIHHHGSAEQKATYLPKLISGEWTGTMNLTEPQAGSDLGAAHAPARCKSGDHYLITGQKIFITYGEHDCPRTSSTWCWRARPTRRPGCRASRCSSCRSSWSTPTAARRAQRRALRVASSTSSASTPARPA